MTQLIRELPPGWVWTTLGEVVLHHKGKKPKKLFSTVGENRLPYIDIKAFEKGVLRRFAAPGEGVGCSETDVLLVWDGARSGLAGRYSRGIVGSTLMRLSSLGPDSEYIFRFLQMRYDELNSNTRGTGIPHLDPRYVWALPLPLPPLAEQRRIVAKVRSLLVDSTTSRQALSKIRPLLSNFRQSILAKAFSGILAPQDPNDDPAEDLLKRIRRKRRRKWEEDLRERGKDPAKYKYPEPSPIETEKLPRLPKGWVWAHMGELLELIQYGTSKKASATKEEGIPILRMGNIQEGHLEISDLKFIELGTEEKDKYLLRKGDILINRTNSPELVGKAAAFDLDSEFVFASYLIRLRVVADAILPRLLNYALNSHIGQRYIEQVRHQVAGQANINSKNIREMPIPLPPFSAQKRILFKIQELFRLASQVEEEIEDSENWAKMVDQAILTKAFRGELVPQDPNDEPASALLERIKAQKSTGTKTIRTQVKKSLTGTTLSDFAE